MIDIEIKQDWCKRCGSHQPESCLVLAEGPIGFDCLLKIMLKLKDFLKALEEYNYTDNCCQWDDDK